MFLTRPASRHVPRRLGPVLAVSLIIASSRVARAESVVLDGTLAPIVRITIASGDVTIRTWNRSSVAVEGDPSLSVVRRSIRQASEATAVLIPHAQQRTRDGLVTLPAESFVVSTVPAGPRDTVVIKSGPQTPAGPVMVTVPSDSVYVIAYARDGDLLVRDLRAGTLVAFTTRGRLSLENVGGTAFAQTGRGALDVSDSSFERLRARSLLGNIVFERCRTRHIEATSVGGSILYDSGSFEPGLARFESARGDVAIGTQSAALLNGRVFGEGRVYTNFERGSRITGTRDDAQAFVDGGGPVVNATTQIGNVYLYDGTLRTRGQLPAQWRVPIATMERRMLRRDDTSAAPPLAPPLPVAHPMATQRPFTQPFETPRASVASPLPIRHVPPAPRRPPREAPRHVP